MRRPAVKMGNLPVHLVQAGRSFVEGLFAPPASAQSTKDMLLRNALLRLPSQAGLRRVDLVPTQETLGLRFEKFKLAALKPNRS